jgi:hypothetical protein
LTMLAYDTFAFVFAISYSRFNFLIALWLSSCCCCRCCCCRCCCCYPQGCCCCCRLVPFPCRWRSAVSQCGCSGECTSRLRFPRPRFPRQSFLQEVWSSSLATSGRGSTRPWWPRTRATCRGRQSCRQCSSRGNPAPPPRRESHRIPRPCTAWGM